MISPSAQFLQVNVSSAVCVFISYTHDSQEHKKRVLSLAQQLRSHGADAVLDQYLNGHPPEGWPQWMERNIAAADYVLVICTENYRRRFDGNEAPGRGLGATWEGNLTRQELYDAQGKSAKFLPIIFEGDQSVIPAPLRPFTYFRMMEDYGSLLRVLLNQPEVIAAPLGARLEFDIISEPEVVKSRLPYLPLPLAQTLTRSLNAKSDDDAYLSALHFFETTLKLAVATQISCYLRLEHRSDDVNKCLVNPNWDLLSHWVEALKITAPFVTAFSHSSDLAIAGQLEKRRPWVKAASLLRKLSCGHEARLIGQEYSPYDVLDALILAKANSVCPPEECRQMAALVRGTVLEMIEFTNVFGNRKFAVDLKEDGPVGQWKNVYFSLYGDGLRLPLRGSHDSSPPGRRDRELVWIGEQNTLNLSPWLVFEPGEPGRERIGFLHSDNSRSDSGRLNARRLCYVDYNTGDYLNTLNADEELAETLNTLGGRTINSHRIEPAGPNDSALIDDPEDRSSPQWIEGFEILGELGRGAMGIVYKARQGSLRRLVALKVLAKTSGGDTLAVSRFLQEIEALGRCDHPNVVKVLTAGKVKSARYYAMELVDGADLSGIYKVLSNLYSDRSGHLTAEHLLEAVSSSSPGGQTLGTSAKHLVPREIVQIEPNPAPLKEWASSGDYYRKLGSILGGAARGVQHLHDHHIVHRDIKPSNLMLTRDGTRAVVMDLGLAKLSDLASLSGSSQIKIVGTLRYIAPEQLHRNLIGVTPQADIYGLGASLYELACLTPIFDGDTEQRLTAQVLYEEPRPPKSLNSDIPSDQALIIARATAKRPTDRYASALELAEDLELFSAGKAPINVTPPSPIQIGYKWLRQNKARASAAALGISCLALGLFLWNRNRIETYEYSNQVDVRQMPVGLGRLDASASARSHLHTRILYRGGKPIEVQTVNSVGRLISNDEGVAVRQFEYQHGILQIKKLDHNRTVQFIEDVESDGANGTVRTFRTKSGPIGATLRRRFAAYGATLWWAGSEIQRLHDFYDAGGYLREEWFEDTLGRPRPDNEKTYGRVLRNSSDGLVNAEWALDDRHQKVSTRNGVFETAYERDRAGNVQRVCYFRQSGKPALHPDGFSCMAIKRDAFGNEIERRYFGMDGRPTLAKDGYAVARTTYDTRGFRIGVQYFDVSDRPSVKNDGIAAEKITNDRWGNETDGIYFDPHGKRSWTKQGISRETRTFDARGNVLSEAFFGADDKSVTDEHGHHSWKRELDREGRAVRTVQYGVDGKLTETPSAQPIETSKYDDQGNQTELAFVGYLLDSGDPKV